MTLVKWRPRGDLIRVRDEFDRVFDDFFGGITERGDELSERVWSPRIDVAEADDELLVTAELPGVNKDDVKISVQNGNLILRGEKKHEKEEKTENFHRVERSFGAFQRTIGLPVSTDANKIIASFKNGILKVRLPKSEEAKHKEIPISVE